MNAEAIKAELADIRDTAKHAADPREPAGRLAGVMLALIEASQPYGERIAAVVESVEAGAAATAPAGDAQPPAA